MLDRSLAAALLAGAAITIASGAAAAPAQKAQSPPFSGADRTGRQLDRLCGSRGAAEVRTCTAYLLGAADTMSAFGAGGHKAGLCNPQYQPGELPQVFLSWSREHPALLRLDMLVSVSLSLGEKWPCP